MILLFLVPAGGNAAAAEFDIDAGRTVMRRLQYCSHCGSALLVTHVHSGVMVRCPDCGKEQPRLADEYLLTQVYQLCKLCLGPLDPHGHAPGDMVECGNCHTPQTLTRDAFPRPELVKGLGYVPGFPPGSGKKILLFSPDRPNAQLTPVPLDDSPSGELPLSDTSVAMRTIPRPPAGLMPPLPEPEPAARPAKPSTAVSALPDSPPPIPTPVPENLANLAARAEPETTAMTVPTVTADLFGGKRDAAPAGKGYISSGRILARVDGTPIHTSEVERVVAPVAEQLRERATPGGEAEMEERLQKVRREVLDRLIDRELAVREAASLGHIPDPAAVREREHELTPILSGTGVDIRREAIRDVTMSDMRRRYAEKPGSANPEAVREFYRQNKDKMIRPRLLALDQLVVYQDRSGRADRRHYEEIAREISEELERGGRFDQTRERYDEFLPMAGMTWSEPVLQPEGAFSSRILHSAGDLRPGAVFGPLFLEGMALFGKVADERPEGPVPFQEVEKEIQRRLENEAAEKNLDAWLKRLRQKARVEILQ